MDMNADTGACGLNGAHPSRVRKDKAGKKLKVCGYITWLWEQNLDEGQQYLQKEKIKAGNKTHWIWGSKVSYKVIKRNENLLIEEEIVHDKVATHFNIFSKINCDKNILISLKQM